MKLRYSASLLASCALFAVGCAASMPGELENARSAYARASRGPAANLNPAGLHAAKESLDAAEHWYSEEGNTQETRDIAYTAQRRAEVAEVRARTELANRNKEEAVKNMHAAQERQVQVQANELRNARGQLAAQSSELEKERLARAEAEERAAKATAALANIATVKQETRGLVLTLSGEVLFATAKADLLPTAQRKLNEVAETLKQQGATAKMVVEGHADSRGAADFNRDLSRRRAQSVRDYLVTRGVSGDNITAEGFGSERPIADNATAEGRANNRRVEIVVQQQPSGNASAARTTEAKP